MEIEHIGIWTRDLNKMKDFYSGYFGCIVSDKYINEKKKYSSYFLSFPSGARIELMNREDVDKSNIHNALGYSHIAIVSGTKSQVDKLSMRLEEDGVQVISCPRETGDGYYESVVLDPEGNRIEITAVTDCSYQIKKANYEDLEEILYLQKCCYLSEAELNGDYNIPPHYTDT